MVIGYETKTVIEEESPTMDSGDPIDSAWPMFGQNAKHTGKSPYNANNNNGLEKWKFECPSSILGSPIIGKDSTIYVGTTASSEYKGKGHLCAINPNASLKWMYKVKGWNINNAPAIGEDGTVFVGDNDGFLYAVNPDGTEKWNISLGSHSWVGSPTIGEDGTIYVGNLNGDFCAISPNGTVKWQLKFDTAVYSPAIDENGIIYVGSHDSYLYAIQPNGTIQWKFKTHSSIANPSIDENGIIYIGSCAPFNANRLYAIYPNGTLKWEFTPDFEPYGSISGYPAISDDGTIYIATGEGKLYAIDNNGHKKWSIELTSSEFGIVTSPAIGNDGIIFVNLEKKVSDIKTKGYVYAINLDGTIKWESKLKSNKPYVGCTVFSSPVIGNDGTVYCGSWFYDWYGSHGYLHAIGSDESNNPPSKPNIIGPNNGKIGNDYNFTFSSIDPEDENIFYYIDWGDGTDSSWQGPYTSDVDITLNHSWLEWGLYTVRAKAKDIHGAEGDWTTLEVIMPKNEAITSPFLNFLENHPHLFPLLKLLLGL